MSKLMISVAGVRGVVGDGLTPEVVCRWGAAFGSLLGAGRTVVVGRDSRGSGPVIEAALCAGLRGAGCDVRLVGVLPTPTIQLAVEETDAAGGVAVTASHNPIEWNALKFIREDGLFLTSEEGGALRALVEGTGSAATAVRHDRLGGVTEDDSAAERHIEKIQRLPYIDRSLIARRGLRAVVDCGNGAGSFVTPHLLERLGVEVVRLYCEPDGRFPRPAEPRPEHIGELARRVREEKADVGFAHDPDADRIVLVTGSGRALAEEYSLAVACDFLLEKNRGAVVVTNLSTSQMIDEVARRYGARVERTAIGEANVAHRMRATKSVIGGEGNGGVIQPLVHLARDGSAAAALVAQCLAERAVTLDEVIAGIPSFYMTKREIVSSEFDTSQIRAALERRFGPGEIDMTDGLKVTWEKRWVHIRKSGTEPIVRVIAEAPTRDDVEAGVAAIIDALPADAAPAPH